MARPREFDRADALQEATEVFWRNGYDAASMQDLVENMGIGRASLYDTFGSKRELYDEALDCYRKRIAEDLLDPLRRDGPAPRCIRNFFLGLVRFQARKETPGCLMVKSAVLPPKDDAAAAAAARSFLAELEGAFRAVIRRGQEEGGIPKEKSARVLSRFLAHMALTLAVTASIRKEYRYLRDLVDAALAILR